MTFRSPTIPPSSWTARRISSAVAKSAAVAADSERSRDSSWRRSDSVAEAFAQVLGRGEDVRDVVAWVWRTAFAIARGQLAVRAGAIELTSTESNDPEVPEQAVELIEALARLRPSDRELIVLCHVGGWTPKELADIAGLPAGTVRVRLHRATRRARELFTEEELR